jgi:hypothetical protein
MTLVKNRIARHEGSSLTLIFRTVAALVKGTELLAHQLTLVTAENCTLREANQALSQRRRAKKDPSSSRRGTYYLRCKDTLARKGVEE